MIKHLLICLRQGYFADIFFITLSAIFFPDEMIKYKQMRIICYYIVSRLKLGNIWPTVNLASLYAGNIEFVIDKFIYIYARLLILSDIYAY